MVDSLVVLVAPLAILSHRDTAAMDPGAVGIIASQGMQWGLSGRYWWEGKCGTKLWMATSVPMKGVYGKIQCRQVPN